MSKPFDVLLEFVDYHTPEMSKLGDRILEVSDRASLVCGFWWWCKAEGFQGGVGGTLGADLSHGNHLHPEDEAPFREWLADKLKEKGITT